MTTEGEALEGLLKTFNPIQLDFISRRMTAKNDKEAAEAVGISPDVVYAWPNKQDVNRAVLLAKLDGIAVAREKLKRLAMDAVNALDDIVKDGKSGQRLSASLAVLDRAGLPEIRRIETSGPGGGPIQHEDTGGKERDRALAALADTIAGVLRRGGPGGDGDMDAAERPAVAGVPEPGG